MNKTNLQKICLSALMVFGLSFSCVKEKEQVIPSVYVHFEININDPTFFGLAAINNSCIVNNTDIGVISLGYDNNGVIVYNSGDSFYAYDCTCPYDFPKSVAIISESKNGVAECPVCHTQYILSSSGMPVNKGPGVQPLKEYHTSYNPNTYMLMVYN